MYNMYNQGRQREPNLFEQKKYRIEATINQVLEIEELNEKLKNRLVASNTFQLLELVPAERHMHTGNIKLHIDEIPPGLSYSMSSNEFELTTCTIPFKGLHDCAKEAIGDVDTRFITLNHQSVGVKSYVSLVHPDRELAKNQLKQRVDALQGYFSYYNDKLTKFNDSLLGFIESLIQARKRHLEALRKTNNDMDPFS